MAHIRVLVSILILSLFLAGCQGISELNSAQIIQSPENTNIPFQGTWEIIRYKRTSQLQEDYETIAASERLLGERAFFTGEWVFIADEGCTEVEYQIRKVNSADYFLFHYDIDPNELNIKKSIIDIVSITSHGALFFDMVLLDRETAVIYMDKCFYWLKKVFNEVDTEYADEKREPHDKIPNKEPESKELSSGVFVGLRTTPSGPYAGEGYGDRSTYRTIWISSYNGVLEPILEAPDLFVPRRNGFWILDVKTRKENGFLRDYIESKPLEARRVSENHPSEQEGSLEGNVKKDIMFVGDDYIAVKYSQTEVDDPTITNSYRVLPLEDANNHQGIKVSDIADMEAKDIFYRSAQSHLVSKRLKFSGDLEQDAGEDNFTMVRRNGHWILKGRLDIKNLREDFTIGLMPVGKLINYDELHVSWDIIKEKIPAALDAYTSPNKELLVVVTGNFIAMYSLVGGQISDKPVEKINIKKGESVIMAEWATGGYVARWEKSFNQLNPYIVNE